MQSFITSQVFIQFFFLIEVLGQSDDPNCAKCDSRAICIRLSNATGVSCVCLPGFALSSSTGRCILQGKNFILYSCSYVTQRSEFLSTSKERKTKC